MYDSASGCNKAEREKIIPGLMQKKCDRRDPRLLNPKNASNNVLGCRRESVVLLKTHKESRKGTRFASGASSDYNEAMRRLDPERAAVFRILEACSPSPRAR